MFVNQRRTLVCYDTPLVPEARILMCGLPGAYIAEDGSLGLSESRLYEELVRLKRSNVDVLFGFVEDEELGCFAYEDITDHAAKLGIATERLAIEDYRAPSEHQDSDWCALRSVAARLLKKKRSIAFHCMAGIGRSGMMAGSLLVYLGMSSRSAFRTVRRGEPRALESDAQLDYLLQHH